MDWIKRNLFFVVGGVVSLLLLGGAGYYIWSEYARNNAASDKLTEVYSSLESLAKQQPGPGKTNTETAKLQEQDLRKWVNEATAHFQPIPGIPAGTNVSSKDFGLALSRTVNQLQRAAEDAGIALPPKYGFSFSKQLTAMTFAPGSLDQLAAQLGETKAIMDILFATRINALDSIQRVRVSEDDLQGSTMDYIENRPVTNDMAIINPYLITFRCFSSELSRVMAGFAVASNTFIIKTVNVTRADGSGATPGGAPGINGEAPPPGYPQPGYPQPGMPVMREGGYPGAYPGYPQPGATPPPVATTKGGLQVVLKEQLLRVVIELELVKLQPKS